MGVRYLLGLGCSWLSLRTMHSSWRRVSPGQSLIREVKVSLARVRFGEDDATRADPLPKETRVPAASQRPAATRYFRGPILRRSYPTIYRSVRVRRILQLLFSEADRDQHLRVDPERRHQHLLDGTLMSRAVVIKMRRRAPRETVEPYRRRPHVKQGEALRDRLAAWAIGIDGDLIPPMPEGITDRNADVREALLAIADAAGGEWSKRARVAAVALVALSQGEPPTMGVRLLADLRTVFGDADALSTEALLIALHKLDDAPWGDIKGKPLDSRGLAARLRKYDVKPKVVRVGPTHQEATFDLTFMTRGAGTCLCLP